MQVFTRELEVADAPGARLEGYVLDNFPGVDPDRRRPAVLILPGGAYLTTVDREAEPIALKLVGQGYHAFALRYPCPPKHFSHPVVQAAAAIALIRQHAETWNVDPDAIVIAGFSAGGHAAAFYAESWDSPLVSRHGFTPEQVRPNGLVLGYPVITSGEHAHQGSINNLLGADRDDATLLDLVSLERHVTSDVPPTFLWSTVTDGAVPVQNSLLFVDALVGAGVSVEAHLYPSGGHGLSLATGETASSPEQIEPGAQSWFGLLADWLARQFPAAPRWP